MRVVVSVALAFAACALAACGGSSEDAAPPPLAASPQAGADREPAPSIGGESLDGVRRALADFRARPVLVNVWSSW